MARVLLTALLLTVLAPPAPAASCPMQGKVAAPCCASDASCDMSLRTAGGCCRIETVSAAQRPAAVRAAGKNLDDRPDAAVMVAAGPVAIDLPGETGTPGTGAPPGFRPSVPLYILNASILR